MQLDHTRIPIQERNFLDILDLSLKVTAVLAGPLLVTAAAAAVPLMLLNWWLIGWIPYPADGAATARYLWLMSQLVFIEAPLASVPLTLLLGKVMFFQSSSLRELMREVVRLLPRLVWCQLVVRGIAAAWLLAALIPREGNDMSAAEVFLPIVACYVALLRGFRPFTNEIILLERNPLRSRDPSKMTVARRSAALHGSSSGELFSRWLRSVAVAILMCLSVTFTLWFVQGMLLFDWRWGTMMLDAFIPAAMWMVAAYFSVVRFLSYLDLRIRREGWEVELTMRAAAARLAVARWPSSLVIAAILLLPAPAVALEHEQAVQAAAGGLRESNRYPWYDREQDQVARVEVWPDEPPGEIRDWQWKADSRNLDWSGFWRAVEVMAWILLALLLGAIAFLLLRAFQRRVAGELAGSPSGTGVAGVMSDADQIDELPFQVHGGRADLLREARRCYEAGDYTRAIVFLFSYQLVHLDRNHLLRLAKGKTNRQYLREIRAQHNIVQILGDCMVPFEEVFFGRRGLDRGRFEACWNRLDEFHDHVRQARE